MLEFLFEIVVEVLFYWTGRVVVLIATLNRVRCEPLSSDDDSNAKNPSTNLIEDLTWNANGRRVLSVIATQCVGMTAIAIAVGAIIAAAMLRA